MHCQGCHQLPEPGDLDSLSWARYVLPRMGHFMGILPSDSSQNISVSARLKRELQQFGYFPDKARLNPAEWQKLKAYFLNNAPERLPAQSPAVDERSLSGFSPRLPDFRLSPPGTSLIRIHEGQLYLGDVNQQMLYEFNAALELQKAARVKEGAVDLQFNGGGMLLTVMGSFSPTDESSGFVMDLPVRPDKAPRIILDKLKRPVDTKVADLNQDGRPDLIVSEFGQWNGRLAWWENHGDRKFSVHTLSQPAGAIKTLIKDINEDGKSDIIALFGQGDEGIRAYINQGEGNFQMRRLIDFLPSYGSSNIRMTDFDRDGDEDIIYTAGDNADYYPVLKPYHGIYIFFNDGNYQFSKKHFFPLPGAYDAIVRDYDMDGDMDIAAISFFPDYSQEEPLGFVFLEQQADGNFVSQSFSEQLQGRWIVMDAGDLDGDGDLDIALGSMTFETIPQSPLLAHWVNAGIPFIILKNLAID